MPVDDLQHVCAPLNVDDLIVDIARCLVCLKTATVELNDVDLALRNELARFRVINKIIALENRRCSFPRFRQIGIRQLIFCRRNIFEQFHLFRRQLMIAFLAASVFDVIKDFNVRIGMRTILRARRNRQ